MKDNELIVCRDVSLGYEGRSVLTGLNLTISKGTISAWWVTTAPASPP